MVDYLSRATVRFEKTPTGWIIHRNGRDIGRIQVEQTKRSPRYASLFIDGVYWFQGKARRHNGKSGHRCDSVKQAKALAESTIISMCIGEA